MVKILIAAFFWTYVLFIGFFFYAAALQAWNRLKIGIKILVAPALCVFGVIDIAFNVVVGSIIFWELPFVHGLTFSQRCSYHLTTPGYKGKVAGAFSVPLNAVLPGHIH